MLKSWKEKKKKRKKEKKQTNSTAMIRARASPPTVSFSQANKTQETLDL